MSFYQIRNRKLQKNCKKIKKFEKHHYAPKISGERQRKVGEKKIVSMSSYLNKNKKFQKNSKKIQKK